jgi:hypothetical protein
MMTPRFLSPICEEDVRTQLQSLKLGDVIEPSLMVTPSELANKITALEADVTTLRGLQFEPMVWEASSLTIQGGRDIVIALPDPRTASQDGPAQHRAKVM